MKNKEPFLTSIMLAVFAGQGGFFFLDVLGGTGKAFLISLILAEIRSNNAITFTVASSGIAYKYSLEALNRTLKDIKTTINYLAALCYSFQVISDKHFPSFHVQHTLMSSTLA